MAKTFTVQDFFKQFSDDDSCLDHLMVTRYGASLHCPKCGKNGKFHRVKKRPVYECQWCGHHISPMAGTPFESSHTPLQKWFYAMYLFTTSRHGVPAKELQRQLGVTYKTAWRMGHQIRKYLAAVDGDSGLSGHVEVDETYVGGRRAGGKRGRGAAGKTTVFGMLQRTGNIMTHIVPNVRRKTLYPIIQSNITAGSTISSDELTSYATLKNIGYTHGTVDHGREQWANGIHHVTLLKASGRRLSAASKARISTYPKSTWQSTLASLSADTTCAVLRNSCFLVCFRLFRLRHSV